MILFVCHQVLIPSSTLNLKVVPYQVKIDEGAFHILKALQGRLMDRLRHLAFCNQVGSSLL